MSRALVSLLLFVAIERPRTAFAHPHVPQAYFDDPTVLECISRGGERACTTDSDCNGDECALYPDGDDPNPGICVTPEVLLLCVRPCSCRDCACPERPSMQGAACYDYVSSDGTATWMICSYRPPDIDPFCGAFDDCEINVGADLDMAPILNCFGDDLATPGYEGGDCEGRGMPNSDYACACGDGVTPCHGCAPATPPPSELAPGDAGADARSDADDMDAGVRPPNGIQRFRGGGGCSVGGRGTAPVTTIAFTVLIGWLLARRRTEP